MLALVEVLSELPPAFRPSWLLPGNSYTSPLESALAQVLTLNNLNPFRINTYAKTRGGTPLCCRALSRVNANVHFSWLIRVAVHEAGQDGHGDDAEVEQQAPVLEI